MIIKRILLFSFVFYLLLIVIGFNGIETFSDNNIRKSSFSNNNNYGNEQRQIKNDSDQFLKFKQYILNKNPYFKTILLPSVVNNIFEYSEQYGIDPITVLAIMYVESTYKIKAKGKRGEVCLMQVDPEVWVHDDENFFNLKNVGIVKNTKNEKVNPATELWNPGKCIQAGVYILSLAKETCEIWESKEVLKKRGYYSINHCMIIRYNGAKRGSLKRDYYQKVTSVIGDYYYFNSIDDKKNLIVFLNNK